MQMLLASLLQLSPGAPRRRSQAAPRRSETETQHNTRLLARAVAASRQWFDFGRLRPMLAVRASPPLSSSVERRRLERARPSIETGHDGLRWGRKRKPSVTLDRARVRLRKCAPKPAKECEGRKEEDIYKTSRKSGRRSIDGSKMLQPEGARLQSNHQRGQRKEPASRRKKSP